MTKPNIKHELIANLIESFFNEAAVAFEKLLDEKLETVIKKNQVPDKPTNFEEDLITIPEFAKSRGISLPTANKYLNYYSGEIKRYRFGGRKVWLRKSEIESAFSANK